MWARRFPNPMRKTNQRRDKAAAVMTSSCIISELTASLHLEDTTSPFTALTHHTLTHTHTHRRIKTPFFHAGSLIVAAVFLLRSYSHIGPLITKHWALFILSSVLPPLHCLTSITHTHTHTYTHSLTHTERGQFPPLASFPHMNTDTLAKTATAVCLMSDPPWMNVFWVQVCVCVCVCVRVCAGACMEVEG